SGLTDSQFASFFDGCLLRKEKHPYPIIFRRIEFDPFGGSNFLQKIVRSLNEYPCPITRIRVAAAGPAVFHIFQNGQRIADDLMRFYSFNVGNKSYPTSIVFKRRIV